MAEGEPEDLAADADCGLLSTQVSYTDAGLDAGLEGQFVVEAFVDGSGRVTETAMPKKIGYGMDERLLAAVRAQKCTPRRDKLGHPQSAWTQVKIRLQIGGAP